LNLPDSSNGRFYDEEYGDINSVVGNASAAVRKN
jgi:hypothetical protein